VKSLQPACLNSDYIPQQPHFSTLWPKDVSLAWSALSNTGEGRSKQLEIGEHRLQGCWVHCLTEGQSKGRGWSHALGFAEFFPGVGSGVQEA
jgi:hypothetical protein